MFNAEHWMRWWLKKSRSNVWGRIFRIPSDCNFPKRGKMPYALNSFKKSSGTLHRTHSKLDFSQPFLHRKGIDGHPWCCRALSTPELITAAPLIVMPCRDLVAQHFPFKGTAMNNCSMEQNHQWNFASKCIQIAIDTIKIFKDHVLIIDHASYLSCPKPNRKYMSKWDSLIGNMELVRVNSAIDNLDKSSNPLTVSVLCGVVANRNEAKGHCGFRCMVLIPLDACLCVCLILTLLSSILDRERECACVKIDSSQRYDCEADLSTCVCKDHLVNPWDSFISTYMRHLICLAQCGYLMFVLERKNLAHWEPFWTRQYAIKSLLLDALTLFSHWISNGFQMMFGQLVLNSLAL